VQSFSGILADMWTLSFIAWIVVLFPDIFSLELQMGIKDFQEEE
jgi:hypothetical protein